jgi:hypothetical protein
MILLLVVRVFCRETEKSKKRMCKHKKKTEVKKKNSLLLFKRITDTESEAKKAGQKKNSPT